MIWSRSLVAVMAVCASIALTTSPASATKKFHTDTSTMLPSERMFAAPIDFGETRQHRRGARRIAYDANGNDARVVAHPSGCPRTRFCGCGVSVKVFGRPVRELFLASNWRKFPSAMAAAGMAAWRYGHVMYIEEYLGNNMARVYDPNSGGHQTRVHVRSLAGYRIVNPNAGKYAALR